MRRSILAFALFAASVAVGQEDSSLTREFGHLSAKERARIAKQEVEDAAKDTRFQEAMVQAEALFQQKQYDAALAGFQDARALRPLNVYPKVKIQDLQALIAKREAAKAAEEVRVIAPPPLPPDTASTATATAHEDRAVAPVEVSRPVPVVEPTRKTEVRAEKRPDPIVVPAERVPAERVVVEPLPGEGMHERTYVEGRAIVLERKVVHGSRMEVYRKVTHPWGQVVHFRDGAVISERQWSEAFPAE